MRAHAPSFSAGLARARSRWRRGLVIATLAWAVAVAVAVPAGAVITTVADTGNAYAIAVRVGTLGSTVDTVAFNITGANAGLTPIAATGTPAIDIWVMPTRPISTTSVARPVTLRVDSSVALACQSGGCGATAIPFSEISWVASNNSIASTGDIQNGRFNGTVNQQIANYNANATVCSGGRCAWGGGTWSYLSRNVTATHLLFSYDNDVVYPAGNYRGTVRFTASME